MCSRSDKLSLKQSILNNASEWETERAFRLFQWENLSHVTQDAHSRTKETVLFPLFLRQLLFSIRLLAVHVLIYSNISIPLLTCVCVCVFSWHCESVCKANHYKRHTIVKCYSLTQELCERLQCTTFKRLFVIWREGMKKTVFISFLPPFYTFSRISRQAPEIRATNWREIH